MLSPRGAIVRMRMTTIERSYLRQGFHDDIVCGVEQVERWVKILMEKCCKHCFWNGLWASRVVEANESVSLLDTIIIIQWS
jgi:hypothetical protein